MDKVEKRMSFLWSKKDIQEPFWLCIYDYKLGNIHFEIVKDPISGMYRMSHNVNPELSLMSFDMRDLLKSFFEKLALHPHSRFVPFRPYFIRYLGFMKKLEREPTLF